MKAAEVEKVFREFNIENVSIDQSKNYHCIYCGLGNVDMVLDPDTESERAFHLGCMEKTTK